MQLLWEGGRRQETGLRWTPSWYFAFSQRWTTCRGEKKAKNKQKNLHRKGTKCIKKKVKGSADTEPGEELNFTLSVLPRRRETLAFTIESGFSRLCKTF